MVATAPWRKWSKRFVWLCWSWKCQEKFHPLLKNHQITMEYTGDTDLVFQNLKNDHAGFMFETILRGPFLFPYNHTYIHIHLHYIYIYMYTCIHICTYIYIYVHIRTCTCICIYTYMYILYIWYLRTLTYIYIYED